jgi:RNA polymerase sigma factor (sigma-70 family)
MWNSFRSVPQKVFPLFSAEKQPRFQKICISCMTISLIPGQPDLSDAELARLAQAGDDEAAWTLASRMKPDIEIILDQTLKNRPLHGVLQVGDLRHEALLACFAAAKTWPQTVLYKTYASQCIRNSIQHSFASFTAVLKIEGHTYRKLCDAKMRFDEFEEQHGRKPESDEEWQCIGSQKKSSTAKHYLNVLQSPCYIDAPTNIHTLESLYSHDNPSEIIQNKELRAMLLEHLDVLEPQQKEVLCMAFGINNEMENLFGIQKKLNLSPRKVRKLLAAAIATLRGAISSIAR